MSTHNLDSPPPGLSDGPAVNWRHGHLTFVEHNISGLLHSQLGDPHLITTFVLVSQQISHRCTAVKFASI